MVNVEIVVTDPKDNAIEGIALQIKVSGNDIIFGPTRPYYLYGITDATGKYVITNAQAYANFDVTANYDNQSPIWTKASGNTSTTATSGGYIHLTLQEITNSTCGTTCSPNCPCPSGYSCINGQCIKNNLSNPLLNFSWLDIFLILGIIVVIVFLVMKLRGKKA